MTKGIQPWRRLAEVLQAVIIVGLPFLKISGQSALRFDVPSLQLHFFGVTLWMEEFFIVLAGLIFLTFLIVLVTTLFGRVWCGWLCPQTVIVDFSRFIDRLDNKGVAYKSAAYAAIFGISALVAANLIWYFVSPYEFFRRLFAGELGSILWGFWIVLTAILFLNFAFLRHKFCATVCPYSKVQSVLYDNRTMVIAFDDRRKEECMNCAACVKTCPVNIDIRQGLKAACINCAECIDKCAMMMRRKQKKSLIDYSFGMPGETGRLLRQNVLLIGSLVLASLIFLVYLSISRVVLDFTVLPNSAYMPRTAADGSVVNSYVLSVENRSDRDMNLTIEVRDKEGAVRITPDKASIEKGQNKKIPIYVSIKKTEGDAKSQQIDLLLESKEDRGLKAKKRAYFLMPWEAQ